MSEAFYPWFALLMASDPAYFARSPAATASLLMATTLSIAELTESTAFYALANDEAAPDSISLMKSSGHV